MIFPFKNKPKIDFILMLIYYHAYGSVPEDESTKLAEHYKNTIKRIHKILPKNVLLIDFAMPVRSETKLEVEFFSLREKNVEDADLKNTVIALKKILKQQFEKSEINNAIDFFEYGTEL